MKSVKNKIRKILDIKYPSSHLRVELWGIVSELSKSYNRRNNHGVSLLGHVDAMKNRLKNEISKK